MANILIIGAGLTGLSAAYHLEKRGFTDYKLYEKEATVGGLCRSVTQDGFTFDFTGHLLHASDEYFRTLLTDLVGFDNLNTINRRSYIYSHQTFTDYPFQVNLHGLPSEVIAQCIEGYALRERSKRKPKHFADWAEKNFGTGIAQHFFYPFQRKIFDYDLKKVSASWTGRFVPQTSLKEMIDGALGTKKEKQFGYNSQFYYPKVGGINFWINKLADALQQKPITNTAIEKVDLQQKVVYFANGETESFNILINTMPLDTLLRITKETSTTRMRPAADKLICNSVLNFNLGIARENLSTKHWIYFPENEFPFYRVGFTNNFAQSMAPAGCSSLYGELSYVKRSKNYVAKKHTQAHDAITKLLNINKQEIVTQKTIHISHAYVIYDFWRERNLQKLHNRLIEQNVYSVGRYGEWKYSSMQEAVLDGKKVAEQVTVLPATSTFYMDHAPQQKPTEKTI